jgi:hypothetical protein
MRTCTKSKGLAGGLTLGDISERIILVAVAKGLFESVVPEIVECKACGSHYQYRFSIEETKESHWNRL